MQIVEIAGIPFLHSNPKRTYNVLVEMRAKWKGLEAIIRSSLVITEKTFIHLSFSSQQSWLIVWFTNQLVVGEQIPIIIYLVARRAEAQFLCAMAVFI